MVIVFKTNVEAVDAKVVLSNLISHYPNHSINFDLEDVDRILRIEVHPIEPERIINLLQSNNYYFDELL